MIIPVIVIGFGLILLALPIRRSRRSGVLDLVELADQLAVAVGAQWEAEAQHRRLNDPYPLPVTWTAADRSLTDSWDSLVTLATSGAGWPEPPPSGTWAASPADLAGKGEDLVKVVARVPTGRLVVLGEPGAGKTMLMVRLVLDLLARRAKGGPVPFLAPVASWDPASQRLRDWLVVRLLIDHPALADPPVNRAEPTQAEALLVSGLILPILDGLDEIPEEVRGPAISQINDALRPGEQVVATCRSKEYLNAVRPEGGAEATLRAAAAIQLRPLDADAVRGYLCDDAAGPVARARLAPVLAELGADSPVGQALQTPLMVSLARAIYNPRSGELAGTLPDPVELCHQTDKEAVESLLFDAYIPAAYRHDPKIQEAEKWLVFLADYLEWTVFSPDLAWWRLSRTPEIANLEPSAVAAASARLVRSSAVTGASAVAVTSAAAAAAAAAAAVIALSVPQSAAMWLPVSGSFQRDPSAISSAASPKASLALARRTAIVTAAFAVSCSLSYSAVLFGVVFGSVFGVIAAIGAGVGGGVAAVALRGPTRVWLRYEMVRTWLALRGQLPWWLMSFLADAHRHGVLRQTGAIYQFRHIELQHRLAIRNLNGWIEGS
jgi:NACHT domain